MNASVTSVSRDEIIPNNPMDEFVRSRGHELTRAGQNFVTSGCPVAQHKRGHRPVMIYPETQSWWCHDCKRGGTVIDWVICEKGVSAGDAMQLLGAGSSAAARGNLIVTYDYADADGQLLYQVCRFQPKDFRQRRPDGNGGWHWNMRGVERVLYRLPEVLRAGQVCIAEGEKDVDCLVGAGFNATCNPGGAGKWRDEYSETLRGKEIVVFPDVDEPGRKHAAEVVESLSGSASVVRCVNLPAGFKDVSDYIGSLPPTASAADAIQRLIDDALIPSDPKPRSRQPVEAEIDIVEEAVELPIAPSPYSPPPLALLPSALRDYVSAAAEALNVDSSYILLPLLSSLGSAIGNTRSILLKRGFVQPPIIWTSIIGRSGSRKSPSLDAGCFAAMDHERELTRQNKEQVAAYEEQLSEWNQKHKKEQGAKPDLPPSLTSLMDDLTLAALADALETNPRGMLVKKDELSHWFASMDQFHNGKGADVSRWLSLHTGAFFGFDRKTDHRRSRLWEPRVCITGGIQPTVLTRVLTPDFFERGLPARFLFAAPPTDPDRWSDHTIAERIQAAVRDIFATLYKLQGENDGEARPKILCLDAEAKDEFVRYYNECGAAAAEADEREEAAWSKLSGYAARLALVGECARNPGAEMVTVEAMAAACALAHWFGAEAGRIYATMSETDEQSKARRLVEFIQRRGGTVRVSEVVTNYRPLKNQTAQAQEALAALQRAGYGSWASVPTTARGGKPTSEFRLQPQPRELSASAIPDFLPRDRRGYADADMYNSRKTQPISDRAEALVI